MNNYKFFLKKIPLAVMVIILITSVKVSAGASLSYYTLKLSQAQTTDVKWENIQDSFLDKGNLLFAQPNSNEEEISKRYAQAIEFDMSRPNSSIQVISVDEYNSKSSVIFAEDAENSTSPWQVLPEKTWQRTIELASQGSYSWKTGNENNANNVLVSPSFSLVGLNVAMLQFDHWYELETSFDFGYVEISTDGGTLWEYLARYNGQGNSWITERIDLSGYCGQQNVMLRFRYESDDSVVSKGWFVDNIKVVEPAIFQFSDTNYKVGESSGSAIITVNRTGDITRTSTVNYLTGDETATQGIDYVLTSGALIFEPGETSKTITVEILKDDFSEGIESVKLSLSSPSDGDQLGSLANASLGIEDDDVLVLLTENAESTSTAWKISPVDKWVRTMEEVSQGAYSWKTNSIPGDYTENLLISPSFSFVGHNMAVLEFDHKYDNRGAYGYVEISTDDGRTWGNLASYYGLHNWTTERIDFSDYIMESNIKLRFRYYVYDSSLSSWFIDNINVVTDTVQTLQFSNTNYTIDENNGFATILVDRTGDISGTSTLGYTTLNGTSTQGIDYTSTSGTLTFGPGETSKSFTVEILNDDFLEGDESVYLSLNSPSDGAQLGFNSYALLTIKDDEVALFTEDAENNLTEWQPSPQGKWVRTFERSSQGSYSWKTLSTNDADYSLVSPAFSLVGHTRAFLQFDHWYELYYDSALIEISLDGGTSWNQLVIYNEEQTGWGIHNWNTESIDISSYTGQPNVKLRFRYKQTGLDYYPYANWYVDNINIIADTFHELEVVPPSDLNVISAGSSQINLNWAKVPYASSYTIYRAISSNGEFSQIGTTGNNTYYDAGLLPLMAYSYKVSSNFDIGESSKSEVVSGITLANGVQFEQGMGYQTGNYDHKGAQPTSSNWDRQSRFIGPDLPVKRWELYISGNMTSSPVIANQETIYIGSTYTGSPDGYLYSVNPDGSENWSIYRNGAISSPVIATDGTIYIGCEDKYLYALNPDGSVKWSFQTQGPIPSSPAIGTDGTIYVGSNDGKLYAINPNGTKKWEYSIGDLTFSSPAIGTDGTLYIGAGNGMLYAVDSFGTLKWELQTGSEIVSSPTIGANGVVYVGSNDGNLYAINTDGSKKWSFQTGGLVKSPAIASDDTIYIGSADNKLYALDSEGNKKWEFQTGNVVASTPIIGSDGTIYFGSDDKRVYAVNPDGSKKWEFFTEEGIETSPAIGSDGTLYVGSQSNYYGNKLYAINVNAEIGIPVVSPEVLGSYQINLRWAPVLGATSYNIYRSTSLDGSYFLAGSTSEVSYADYMLEPSTTYWYKVTAVDDQGEGAPSRIVSVTTYPSLYYTNTGTIRWFDFEGGFYGIVTDYGERLIPVSSSKASLKDGLRISFEYLYTDGAINNKMWGKPIKILNMKTQQ